MQPIDTGKIVKESLEKVYDSVFKQFIEFLPDLETVIIWSVSLYIIYTFAKMMFKMLLDGLAREAESSRQQYALGFAVLGASKSFHQAQTYREYRDNAEAGSVDYEYYNSLYRSSLNESVRLTRETGEVIVPEREPAPPAFLETDHRDANRLFGFPAPKEHDTLFDSWLAAGSASSTTDPAASSSDAPPWLNDDPGPEAPPWLDDERQSRW